MNIFMQFSDFFQMTFIELDRDSQGYIIWKEWNIFIDFFVYVNIFISKQSSLSRVT